MIHIYQDELDKTDIKSTNEFVKVKYPELLLLGCINFEHLFALIHLLLLLTPILLHFPFQYPLISSENIKVFL